MDRAQFLTELALRHGSRQSVLFTPGPDEHESPLDGAIVIAAPSGVETRWCVQWRERASTELEWFPDESSALEYTLATYFARRRNRFEPPMTEADFLLEIDRRGWPRSWFVLPGDTGAAADGAIAIEAGPPWRVYPSDASRFATTVETEGEAYQSAIAFVGDPRVREAMAGIDHGAAGP